MGARNRNVDSLYYMKLLASAFILCIGCAVTTRSDPSPCVSQESNRLFCGKGSPINICFALASVTTFVPHDRAIVLGGGYSWTMPESDWARLVEFGRTRSYEIPEAEGSR